MSDITLLRDGKLSPVQFAQKVAGEIKDNPIAKAFAPFLLSGLQRLLAKEIGSPIIAGVIVSAITSELNGDPSVLTDELTGIVAGAFGQNQAAAPKTEGQATPLASLDALAAQH